MRQVVQRVDFQTILEEASFVMEGLEPELIEKLVDYAGTKVFAPKGTLLTEDGKESDTLFVLGHGKLGVFIDGRHVSYVVPGEIIGEHAMLKKAPAVADVKVLSDLAYILILDQASVRECLAEHPEVLDRMNIVVHQLEMQRRAAALVSRRRVML